MGITIGQCFKKRMLKGKQKHICCKCRHMDDCLLFFPIPSETKARKGREVRIIKSISPRNKNKEACRLAIIVMVEHDNLSLGQLMEIKSAVEKIKRNER